MIAAAQEREELQREGDDLHRQIQKAEKEIVMLTASLDQLVDRNHVCSARVVAVRCWDASPSVCAARMVRTRTHCFVGLRLRYFLC